MVCGSIIEMKQQKLTKPYDVYTGALIKVGGKLRTISEIQKLSNRNIKKHVNDYVQVSSKDNYICPEGAFCVGEPQI